ARQRDGVVPRLVRPLRRPRGGGPDGAGEGAGAGAARRGVGEPGSRGPLGAAGGGGAGGEAGAGGGAGRGGGGGVEPPARCGRPAGGSWGAAEGDVVAGGLRVVLVERG